MRMYHSAEPKSSSQRMPRTTLMINRSWFGAVDRKRIRISPMLPKRMDATATRSYGPRIRVADSLFKSIKTGQLYEGHACSFASYTGPIQSRFKPKNGTGNSSGRTARITTATVSFFDRRAGRSCFSGSACSDIALSLRSPLPPLTI